MQNETTFKIEKGIEVPGYGGGRPKYPRHTMEVGDSFFIPANTATSGRIQNAAHAAGKSHNKKFTTRTVTGGTRIWRVA